ncbi:MAG: ssl1498 family light-harvesting-like protein [Gloeocapsa sp. DLM2.Bin57]|nr:MAG: ssl1498 family light-harvesting-like protein [Gloeocapsa sp. DLM2.Bin57]
MKKQPVTTTTTPSNKSANSVHYSDGTELIPSGINSDLEDNDELVKGYTEDDEGLINNYAVEPAAYAASYPNPRQQLRYLFWGAGAVVFIVTILVIAFAVS